MFMQRFGAPHLETHYLNGKPLSWQLNFSCTLEYQENFFKFSPPPHLKPIQPESHGQGPGIGFLQSSKKVLLCIRMEKHGPKFVLLPGEKFHMDFLRKSDTNLLCLSNWRVGLYKNLLHLSCVWPQVWPMVSASCPLSLGFRVHRCHWLEDLNLICTLCFPNSPPWDCWGS